MDASLDPMTYEEVQAILEAGGESPWIPLARLVVTSGRLALGDPLLFPQASLEIRCADGDYFAEIKRRGLPGGAIVVSRARVSNVFKFVVGSQIGVVATDTATLAFFDPSAVARHFHQPPELLPQQDIQSFPEAGDPSAVLVRTGLGDGTYLAYQLVTNTGVVGIEVGFFERQASAA